jgi:DNA (cytosine-5)-methyltransferase 1
MRQKSLFAFTTNAAGLAKNTEVVDLFCGIGGFSCGARAAGHRIVLAVDSDPVLLQAHEANHPECVHVCAELPFGLDVDSLLPPGQALRSEGAPWHLHGSPPCTQLSVMLPVRGPDDVEVAVGLVEWFLNLVDRLRPNSWSFEQVNNKAVRHILADMQRRRPLLCDWDHFDAADFGVPQHRKRIIAGTPWLIQNLRESRCASSEWRGVSAVIHNPPRPFIRNSLYSRPDPATGEKKCVRLDEQLRSVDVPAFTMLASGHAKWCDQDGTVLRHLFASEKALIQSFPSTYTLPSAKTVAKMGVGNAVPPALAEVLMQPTQR